MDRLVAYEWPGNVRELANEIERTAALSGPEATIGLDDLSEHVRGRSNSGGGPLAVTVNAALSPTSLAEPIQDWDLNRSVDRLKRAMLIRAIHEAGSKSRAAERLGIPRQSLQKMVKRLEISEAELSPQTVSEADVNAPQTGDSA
jgi:two-component system response regulator HydG